MYILVCPFQFSLLTILIIAAFILIFIHFNICKPTVKINYCCISSALCEQQQQQKTKTIPVYNNNSISILPFLLFQNMAYIILSIKGVGLLFGFDYSSVQPLKFKPQPTAAFCTSVNHYLQQFHQFNITALART